MLTDQYVIQTCTTLRSPYTHPLDALIHTVLTLLPVLDTAPLIHPFPIERKGPPIWWGIQRRFNQLVSQSTLLFIRIFDLDCAPNQQMYKAREAYCTNFPPLTDI